MILTIAQAGHVDEAVAVWTMCDVYGREQDMEFLLAEVIRGRGSSCALTFSVAERGERTKTGADQGAVVDNEDLGVLLNAVKHRLRPKARVFAFDQAHLRTIWTAALRKRGLPARPLHTIRHSKPSHEALVKSLGAAPRALEPNQIGAAVCTTVRLDRRAQRDAGGGHAERGAAP